MQLLLAPDTFKGSLAAPAVCAALERGIRSVRPDVHCTHHPLADGGEGSLDVLAAHLDAAWVTVTVQDPLGRPVRARYLRAGETAYIEMARASGLLLLAETERDPLRTSTHGTGELILHAYRRGVRKVYQFVGGSATNDAGLGMAAALGYRLLDEAGAVLAPVGENLVRLHRIETGALAFDPAELRVQVVGDVTNPLYGPTGAAHVYAPQKGADAAAVEHLDAGLRNAARVFERALGAATADLPGAGAAGGLGAGAVAFLGAQIVSGTATVFALTGFAGALARADYVLTGEGRLDAQSLSGKVVHGVCAAARRAGVRTGAICGAVALSAEQEDVLGLEYCAALLDLEPVPTRAMEGAAALLERAGAQWAARLTH